MTAKGADPVLLGPDRPSRRAGPASSPPSMRTLLRVGDGPVDLSAIDPRGTPGLADVVRGTDPKAWSRAEVRRIGAELAVEQEKLYASARAPAAAPDDGADDPSARRATARLLLVLQAMDCGGKDGTIKNVVGAMNPLGVHIVAFGRPTSEELEHHFLWRIRRALPEPGYVGVFNRSHYEDVLVARVDSLVPADVWRSRYEEINTFERELVDSGVALVKVFLHISAREQRKRLLARLDDPTKRWKYDPADVDARARWADYQAAYADALTECSPPHAPWHVVPADRKWYRNWAVACLVREEFADLRLGYPEPLFDVDAERERLRALGDPDARAR